MVECQLPKLDVAGSTPVSRSEKSWVVNSSAKETYPRVPSCSVSSTTGFPGLQLTQGRAQFLKRMNSVCVQLVNQIAGPETGVECSELRRDRRHNHAVKTARF